MKVGRLEVRRKINILSSDESPLQLVARDTAPTIDLVEGDLYLDDGTNTGTTEPGFRYYDGIQWVDLTADSTIPISLSTKFIQGANFVEPEDFESFRIPFDCTIKSWEISNNGDSNSTCEFDVLVGATNSLAGASSIVDSSPPVMTDDTFAINSTLTGWTTSLTAGQWVFLKLDSITGIPVKLKLGVEV